MLLTIALDFAISYSTYNISLFLGLPAQGSLSSSRNIPVNPGFVEEELVRQSSATVAAYVTGKYGVGLGNGGNPDGMNPN